MLPIKHQMTEAKKNEHSRALKNVKFLFKGFGLTTDMQKSLMAYI